MKNNGALVISLDFELLWGVFDKVNWRQKREYFQNTRKVIPETLHLFEKYDIQCTWATVGMLFNQDWQEWNANMPEDLPYYSKPELSAYNFGQEIQVNETEELCFAPELIKLIIDTPGQEMATHTYSHYYCLEKGQNLKTFEADLLQSTRMAKKFGINLKSLVFPRNQLNEEYLEVCRKHGIENVRSNPTDWYWRDTESDSLINKIFRTGDAYLGPSNKSYNLSEQIFLSNLPISQKASRLLKPFSTTNNLNNLKLNRIRTEMTKAAKGKEIYHLWWHPHNFGEHPQENIKDLEKVLIHFDALRKKYGYLSLNMCETGKQVTL